MTTNQATNLTPTATLVPGADARKAETAEKIGVSHTYKLSHRLSFRDSTGHKRYSFYVWVSTSNRLGLETYAFPSDKRGRVRSWSELPGSQKMTADHALVLMNLGYVLKE